MLYNSWRVIYNFGNNTYPRRIRSRSNLGHIFREKKCVLWAGKYGIIRYCCEECVCRDVTLWHKFSDGRFGRSYTAIFKIWRSGSTSFRSGDELYQTTRRHISESIIFTAVISSNLTHGTVLCGGILGPTNAHRDTKAKSRTRGEPNFELTEWRRGMGWGLSQAPATVWYGTVT
jgi:hypothetical protein